MISLRDRDHRLPRQRRKNLHMSAIQSAREVINHHQKEFKKKKKKKKKKSFPPLFRIVPAVT